MFTSQKYQMRESTENLDFCRLNEKDSTIDAIFSFPISNRDNENLFLAFEQHVIDYFAKEKYSNLYTVFESLRRFIELECSVPYQRQFFIHTETGNMFVICVYPLEYSFQNQKLYYISSIFDFEMVFEKVVY